MEFCDFQCNETMYKRCGRDRCQKRFCFKHGGTLNLRFTSCPPNFPRQDFNVHRSILALRADNSRLNFIGGSATCRNFFEQVLPRATFPKNLVNDFCNGCLNSLKLFYLRKLDEVFFPILRRAKVEGLICEVHEICFMDVHHGVRCSLCNKRSCYNHARYCTLCAQVICASDPCEIKHCTRHPIRGNRNLAGLDAMD